MTYFKIVEYENDTIKTLFHGINGSRTIPANTWLKAVIKPVRDGSKGTEYLSGWHIMKTKTEAKEYLTRFSNTKTKRIVSCHARHVWKKAHSRDNVFLAKEIKIL